MVGVFAGSGFKSGTLTVSGEDQKKYPLTPTKIKLHKTDKTISYSASQTFKAS
jgi:hypothetical protein